MSEYHCAKCKSDNIEYNNTKNEDGEIQNEYECNDCGFQGIEIYTLQYSHTCDKLTGNIM